MIFIFFYLPTLFKFNDIAVLVFEIVLKTIILGDLVNGFMT